MLFCAIPRCTSLGTWISLPWGDALCDLHYNGDQPLGSWTRVQDVTVPW